MNLDNELYPSDLPSMITFKDMLIGAAFFAGVIGVYFASLAHTAALIQNII